ncbi:MAG: tRNA (guanosine(37)-N1)-methyltransferase TrmD [Chloroflexi bacterium]|nr:tRNA (guanosine(37)-N1)-methyltransferase TrmD [Chloroflexota bacterium]
MRFDIFTLFPEMFAGPFASSIVKRAQEMGRVEIALHDIRAYATDKHHTTDDTPYGGGGGMVMKPEPIFAAVERVLGERLSSGKSATPSAEIADTVRSYDMGVPIILLTPQGRLFTQSVACELASHEQLLLICGRYEGVDERVREHLVTDEISIGDYVLSGGEIPAMVVVDAVVRLLPGVLGDPAATHNDSHATGLLEYPHYTRPPVFRGWAVPEVLLSGNHAEIARWRREQALRRTLDRRPDLLGSADLTPADRAYLEKTSSLSEKDFGSCP